MKKVDKKEYIKRYTDRLNQFGYSHETLGWGKHGRQEIRFGVLAELAMKKPNSSVLDVGCGFADLYDFLKANGWQGKYTGIDIVPSLLEIAKQRHPDIPLLDLDITEKGIELQKHDFVIASGVFNASLIAEDNNAHIVKGLKSMFAYANEAVCVDFMSSYVDFQKPGSWHTDPSWAFAEAKKISKRVALRHDYMPFEFSLFINKNDSISELRLFKQFEDELNAKQN